MANTSSDSHRQHDGRMLDGSEHLRELRFQWVSRQRSGRSAMANGWAGDGAVQEQIDSTVDDAVQRARSRLHRGASLTHCEECGDAIPEARRQAVPGVHLCIRCQSEQDAEDQRAGGYNRRASKDSQLR
jgi:phage/conjugal plasmid C-4 type zinc finger TraR family protein